MINSIVNTSLIQFHKLFMYISSHNNHARDKQQPKNDFLNQGSQLVDKKTKLLTPKIIQLKTTVIYV